MVAHCSSDMRVHVYFLAQDGTNVHRLKVHPREMDNDILYYPNGETQSRTWQGVTPLSLGDVLVCRHAHTLYIWIVSYADRFQLLSPAIAWTSGLLRHLLSTIVILNQVSGIHVHVNSDSPIKQYVSQLVHDRTVAALLAHIDPNVKRLIHIVSPGGL